MSDVPSKVKHDTRQSIAIGNAVVAVAVSLSAFVAAPVRSAWTEVPAASIAVLLLASAAGLARRAPWADRITRAAAVATLVAGLLGTAAFTFGMTFARAVAGPGAGPGPRAFALGLLIIIPYLVAYPAVLLVWLASREHAR